MSDTSLPKPPKVPCGTCPYRRDVPSGIWAAEEYAKLPDYDGETWEQALKGAIGLFMCHQRDGCLCGGWLMVHDRHHLLALRITPVDPSVWGYNPTTPVFGSGAEAAAHGMKDIEAPSVEAAVKIEGLVRQRRNCEKTK
jgi:hypothetical protein